MQSEWKVTPSSGTPACLSEALDLLPTTAKGNKQAVEPELLAGSLGACLQSQYVGSGGRRSRSSNHRCCIVSLRPTWPTRDCVSRNRGTTIVSLPSVLLIGRFSRFIQVVQQSVCVCVNKHWEYSAIWISLVVVEWNILNTLDYFLLPFSSQRWVWVSSHSRVYRVTWWQVKNGRQLTLRGSKPPMCLVLWRCAVLQLLVCICSSENKIRRTSV